MRSFDVRPTRRVLRRPLSPTSRRGVLLLLILALLAMFGLIGMAFVVMTGQAQRSAKSIERIGQTDSTTTVDADQLLQQAVRQVLRGSNNPTSVMGAHSLLEDLYGNEYLTGIISNAAASGIPELVNLSIGTLTTSNLTSEYQVPTDYAKLVLLAQHVGGVLTITSVPTGQDTSLVGQSTRIVASSDSAPLVQITAFPNGKRPPIGSQFTINGSPFSGTGFGYNPNSGLLDLRYDFSTGSLSSAVGTLTALLPNISPAFYTTGSASAVAGAQNNRGNPPGGANEDYDAADFQNLLLAAQVQVGAAVTTLPSLHRPALINYWMHNNPTGTYANFADFWKSGTANKALGRKIMLRPIGAMMANQTSALGTADSVDHPDFTGSNPNFDPIDSTKWDVDNDGDGKPDSVWVDLGLPVRTTSDGRMYKPLFAILCVDLDGRLNLNAHGCLAQTDAARYNPDGSPVGTNVQTELELSTGTGTGFSFTNGAGGGMIATVQLPRGQGYGPAEISLAPLFNNLSDYGNLLTGTATMEGRYGKDKRGPGFCDQTGNTVSGLSLNRWYGYWNPNFGPTWSWWNFLNGAFVADAYGSPPDTYGNGAVALDVAGRPLYLSMGDSILNAPYELNLGSAVPRGQSTTSTVSTPDAPFSPAELERVLRPYDRDTATLPARLTTLAPNLSPTHRLDVTTDSWDIPSPAPFRQTSGGVKKNYPTIAEFLLEQNVPATQLTNLLPLDILSGRKMDVTRLLSQCTPNGNVTFYTSNGTTGTISVPQCFSQDGNVTGPLADRKLVARQLYARYLYVLALLCDDAYWAAGASQAEIARQTAQWAVNVVDFQTNDSAMTPFQYTVNPFGAACWTASTGTPDTDINVVWGCKRPELLISETLAFHDRRTQDEKKDTKDNSESANHTYSSGTDGNFDQKVPPRGALFIELFNPWTNLEAPPTDLYRQIGATSSPWGVDLDRVAPNGNPVWRMVIVDGADAGKDPDDPDPANQPTYERAVYFAAGTVGTATVTLPADTKAPAASTNNYVKYQPTPSAASQFAPILPGRYAVIGPNGTTYIGRATDGSTNNTPYIGLTPNTNPDAAVDQVYIMSGTATQQAPAANTRRAVAITIEPAAGKLGGPTQSFCVSEPIDGYEAQYASPTGTATYGTATGEYTPANDTPIDADPATATTNFTPRYKAIYLQRLADPSRNFHATGNPYRTIDAMPVNLQSFNGQQAGDPANTTNIRFQTCERGTAGTASNNLWSWEPLTGTATSGSNSTVAADLSNQVFPYRLVNTLSYLNSCFGATAGSATYGDRYVGDPQTPFPWLYWPNRPMVSQMGLLLTPGLRSSQ
ncbi:MAG: hypothetical protein ABFC88_09500, partial [Thermoguttaceae bacterium]